MYQYEWIEDAVAHVWMNELYFFYFIKLSFIKDRTNLDSTIKTQNLKKNFSENIKFWHIVLQLLIVFKNISSCTY